VAHRKVRREAARGYERALFFCATIARWLPPRLPLSLFTLLCAAFGLSVVSACTPYRIEYHQRPQFYYQASEEELKDEWIAPDGTIVKFSTDPLPSAQEALAAQAAEAKREIDLDGDGVADKVEPTPTWEERDDGSVKMRAFIPEHVIGNFMQALREERYGEFYDQMLARSTREAFASSGFSSAQGSGQGQASAAIQSNAGTSSGKKAFAKWCARYRRPMMETLNRMGFGFLGPDVLLRKTGNNTFRVGFTPRVASQFKFTTVEVIYEDGGCRLLWVR